MAIKGQNLRLWVGGRVAAAAKSCTVHVAAQIEDVTCKNDTGDWVINECTGKSWDVSCDTLVMNDLKVITAFPTEITASGKWYAHVTPISIPAGSTITVENGHTFCLVDKLMSTITVLASTTDADKQLTYTNTGSAAVNVYLCIDTKSYMTPVAYSISGDEINTDDFIAMLAKGTPVKVHFGLSTGTKNAEMVEGHLYHGNGVVSDISITAANRQNGTVTIQITGSGEFAFGDAD